MSLLYIGPEERFSVAVQFRLIVCSVVNVIRVSFYLPVN
jgi:hypothetical protein